MCTEFKFTHKISNTYVYTEMERWYNFIKCKTNLPYCQHRLTSTTKIPLKSLLLTDYSKCSFSKISLWYLVFIKYKEYFISEFVEKPIRYFYAKNVLTLKWIWIDIFKKLKIKKEKKHLIIVTIASFLLWILFIITKSCFLFFILSHRWQFNSLLVIIQINTSPKDY